VLGKAGRGVEVAGVVVADVGAEGHIGLQIEQDARQKWPRRRPQLLLHLVVK